MASLRFLGVAFAASAVLALTACGRQARVGPEGTGYRVATSQLVRPAGTQVEFDGRPVDLALSRDGRSLYVKDNRGVVVIDVEAAAVLQELAVPGRSSLHGIAVDAGGRVWTTDAGSGLHELLPQSDGTLKLGRRVTLPPPEVKGAAYGCGIAIQGSRAFVCASRSNTLVEVDLDAGTSIRSVPTGAAPFDVEISGDGSRAFVSCWGAMPPGKGESTVPSSGTPIEVDERGVAKGGVVVALELLSGRTLAAIPVGQQPSDIVLSADGGTAYVANANADTVSEIDTARLAARAHHLVRPDERLMFGSAPNAIGLSPDGKSAYVALGSNNMLAVFDVRRGFRRTGLIPTGWYPAALATRGDRIFVANVKGVGSRRTPKANGGRSVYDYRGTVSIVTNPGTRELSALTKRALKDANVADSLRAMERRTRGVKAVPVPEQLGDPSVIEHVVYVIKENRTYDQVLGDIPAGDGEPELCVFGRDITPNHHALAERYVLLDNYYCNGVNSADGHAWTVEGNASSYLEKSFGGWARSYPFGGDDPLSVSLSGYVWDNILAAGLTFRNYGEFDYAKPRPNGSFIEIYNDFVSRAGKFAFDQDITVERLKSYSCSNYPGWNMNIPDVLRAHVFLDELKAFVARDVFPNFTIVYLPQDHNSGTTPGMPTPRAHMADNDLALGRIVDALSRTKFWAKMAIFVIEDDPQNGFDHVDGHRSICLVISPYAKRAAVVSNFYNQTSVLHTMERILGVPPMNQMDAQAPVMAACFTPEPDFSPYTFIESRVALNELNPKRENAAGLARYWADRSREQDLSRPDAGNDDLRNRMLWYSVKGSRPYPAEYAGAHGKGLATRGLTFDRSDD